jgi:hypothetical protein
MDANRLHTRTQDSRAVAVVFTINDLVFVHEDGGAGRGAVDRRHAEAEWLRGCGRAAEVLLIELTGIGSLRAVLTFAVEAGLELGAAGIGAARRARTRVTGWIAPNHGERAETLTATAEPVFALPA